MPNYCKNVSVSVSTVLCTQTYPLKGTISVQVWFLLLSGIGVRALISWTVLIKTSRLMCVCVHASTLYT